jgi:redox-sensitive bicupin YhaK (pirin superfamily)
MGPRLPVRKVPNEQLFKSEPPPSWFGNPENPSGDKRGWTAPNWLTSRFHFSFAEYSSSKNDSFGVLRVMNDDLVMPKRGFGEHGHANMEICTYVVEGSLTHKDSMGTSETLGRGAIQFMTAGKGVRHSEHNLDSAKPLRFIQMWIVPEKGGLPPNYGSHSTAKEDRLNRWCLAVSPVPGAGVHGGTAPVQIHQDATIRVTELEPGIAIQFATANGRQAYLLCVEGEAAVDQGAGATLERLAEHDAAEFASGVDVTLVAGTKGAHLLVVEMAERKGSGREDL